MPPLIPAATLRPVGPRMTTRPPVMYSRRGRRRPRQTIRAPELRTANRSPTRAPQVQLARTSPRSRWCCPRSPAAVRRAPGLARSRRTDHDGSAGQALADVVVGVAVQGDRHPAGRNAPSDCPAVPVSVMSMVSGRQAVRTDPTGDLRAEHGARRSGRCCGSSQVGSTTWRPIVSAASAASINRASRVLDRSCWAGSGATSAGVDVGHRQQRSQIQPARPGGARRPRRRPADRRDPTASSMDRKPSAARYSRTCSAR